MERDLRILLSIVDLYVKDGIPVSSQKVQEAAGLGISTATIRNLMAGLERRGYLSKQYTSAGRVPTDEGYRCYVNTLLAQRQASEEFSRLFRKTLREEIMDIGTIMACASRFLGSITKNFAVVYGSIMQESRVSRISLVGLEGTRLLVVVNLLPEYERTTALRLEKRFSADVVSRAENLINRVVVGKTLAEAKDALDSIVRDNVTGEGIITREVAINREAIFSGPPAVELYFEEKEHLLERSDYFDPVLLQLLLLLLHNKTYLTSILSKRLAEKTQITIGSENEDEALKPFSLVTAGYRMGGARGVLGVIGPTRMRYDLALGIVGTIAKELQAIGEEYF
ncbi:MAG: heat-inducible transcription repressor HrcA [Candidatus Latescibacteria bacterium]|nr:heat-inducible transcription repressor HrcA [Candidatus Latescibacterota bacterium]NIM64727.1 heat-inducible transcription repressor HrcA [Candidatus Latescibacterota bacterium]NIT01253.1 heat-inducible transcription repressor HrcA [Candidatus Latescibacterota bacterium]NIT38165.1 heat-inducible transcription repressor HrcA [Candidatus Latescibacterota bacterium]